MRFSLHSKFFQNFQQCPKFRKRSEWAIHIFTYWIQTYASMELKLRTFLFVRVYTLDRHRTNLTYFWMSVLFTYVCMMMSVFCIKAWKWACLRHSQAERTNPSCTAGMLKRPASQPHTPCKTMYVASNIRPERTPTP